MQRFLWTGGLVVISALAIPASAMAQKMESGSFLRRPALSRSELVRQLTTDDIAGQRYMDHFGMSREELAAYFGTFRPSRLNEDGTYTVYNWHGTEGYKRLHLKRGTGVWRDRAGRIVMKMNCGNPMITGAQARSDLANQVAENDIAPPVAATPPTPVAAIPPTTSTSTAPETVATTPIAPPVAATPTEPPVAAVVPPTETAPQAIAVGGGGGGGGFLLPLAGLGGLIALAGSGGGGGGNAPVPEPATMLVLGAGTVGMLIKRRKK